MNGAILCFALAFAVVCCDVAAAGLLNVALISDLHLDLWYNQAAGLCPNEPGANMGHMGCDTPLALATKTLTDVEAQHPDMVVCGGDWQRHKMDRVMKNNPLASNQTLVRVADFLAELNEVASQPMARTRLGTNRARRVVLYAPRVSTPLGNNDVTPDYDYPLGPADHPEAPPVARYLADHLLQRGLMTNAEVASFTSIGCFVRHVAPTFRILVINTLLWSVKLRPHVAWGGDPDEQFAYIETALRDALGAGARVMVVSHVPPLTVDPFYALHANDTRMLLQQRFQTRLVQTLDKFGAPSRTRPAGPAGGVVTAAIFAHIHRFTFVGAPAVCRVPIFILPAISPVTFTNPSYLMATVDTTSWGITDLRQRRFNLYPGENRSVADKVWSDSMVSFRSTFGLPGPSAGVIQVEDLYATGRLLAAGGHKFEAWKTMFSSGGPSPCEGSSDSRCRTFAACITTVLGTPADLVKCWSRIGVGKARDDVSVTNDASVAVYRIKGA